MTLVDDYFDKIKVFYSNDFREADDGEYALTC